MGRSSAGGSVRGGAMIAAFALAIGVGTVAVVAAAPEPAQAAVGECPPGTIPAPGNSNPIWTDDNVSIYAGADFRAEGGAAEAEGLMVVQGDADFTRTGGGTFNVGWVGVGSWVVPTPGEIMLAVGGDLSVGAGTVLDVGANARDAGGELRGGNVDVGGATAPDYVDDGTRFRLNNGVLEQGLGALATAPWAAWSADIASESQAFAALPATGSVAVGATLEFTGLTGADPQVFSVDAALLAANPAITFLNVADDVPVIVNVTGGTDVTWAPNYFADESGRVDTFTSSRFGVVAARTLWNFADASSLHVAGTSQVLGTILVPGAAPAAGEATLRVTASTNGRLLTDGTIVMDGAGNEHHNYPWLSEPFQCIPGTIEPLAVGSVTIAKDVSDADAALLPANVMFHGTVVCDDGPTPESQTIAEWYVAPGESVLVDDLPVGATCEIIESLGLGARQFAQPLSGAVFVPAQLAWQTPVWSPDPPVFVVPSSTDPAQLTFTVTNALAAGAFTIQKLVEGDGAPDVDFAGTWSCTYGQTQVGAGDWSLTAGETTDPIPAVLGAVCTVGETAPDDPENGAWTAPIIDSASVLITAGSAETPLEIVITNTFVADQPLGGFDIVKVVEDPDGIGFADEFSGAWTCMLGGDEIASGVWTASTSEPYAVDDIALGADCAVTEDAPADPAGGSWAEADISPASFTVTDAGARVTVVVTNVLTGDGGEGGGGDGGDGDGGGSLPATGGTVPVWIVWTGVGLLVAGGAIFVLNLVRRRRS